MTDAQVQLFRMITIYAVLFCLLCMILALDTDIRRLQRVVAPKLASNVVPFITLKERPPLAEPAGALAEAVEITPDAG